MSGSELSDKHDGARMWIARWCRFLTLHDVDWGRASDPSPEYNCMGHAIGVARWFQARVIQDGIWLNPTVHWPDNVLEDDSIDAYIALAKTKGFEDCDGSEPEPGYEKIVLYYDRGHGDKPFKHAARVVSEREWESKLGPHSDIHHPPNALDEIAVWGTGRKYMRRPVLLPHQ